MYIFMRRVPITLSLRTRGEHVLLHKDTKQIMANQQNLENTESRKKWPRKSNIA